MITPETCSSILEWRYATKIFDPAKKIAPEIWDVLRKSMVLAPSSFGMQLWQLFDVQTPEVREKLKAVSWGQDQVTDASHYVVLCVRRDMDEADCDRHIDRMCEVRGIAPESLQMYKERFAGFCSMKSTEETTAWIERQSYIALGFMMFAAAAMEVDTCAIEGMEPQKYDEILGLEGTPYRAICGLALGYRNPQDKYATTPKVRFDEKDVIRTV